MNKKEKIDKTALVFDPIVFTERQLYREKRKYKIFKSIFVLINLAIFSGSLAVAIVTPMFLAGYMTVDKNWFFFFTAFIAAGTAFAGSIVNFLYVKQKFEKSLKNFHFIQREIIMYASKSDVYEYAKVNKDILLFERVAEKIGYAQHEEVIND